MLVARRKGRVLIVPEDEATGVAWTLPSARVVPGNASRAADETLAARRAARALARRWGQADTPLEFVAQFRHRTFSHDLTVEVWALDSPARAGDRNSASETSGVRWVAPARIRTMAVRSPTLKALKSLRR